MARTLTVIGLGEAVLVEHPDRTEAAGLAALVAIRAVRLGHVGVVVSRIGQDPQAEALQALLTDAGVDVSHLQLDPDLPTGRVVVRAIGDPVARYLDTPAAFDNLQADFDLEDVGQQADAVVYGMLTRRGGQTRSEENRFLGACGAALKLFDLTNRVRDEVDRGQAMSGLEVADGAVLDPVAWSALQPSAGTPDRRAVLEFVRDQRLSFVVMLEPENDDGSGAVRAALHTADEVHGASIPPGRTVLVAAVLSVLVALIRGKGPAPALDLAARVAEHVATSPDDPVPAAWVE